MIFYIFTGLYKVYTSIQSAPKPSKKYRNAHLGFKGSLRVIQKKMEG